MGYKEIYLPNHPYARSNGTVFEHRLIAEKKIGRPLLPTEVVHHIDENKNNNSDDNLIVFKTNEDHSRFHKTGILQALDDGTYISPVQQHRLCKCIYCGKTFHLSNLWKSSSFCSVECRDTYNKNSPKKEYQNNKVSKDTLNMLIHQYPFTSIGKMFNVTDNAVRKWCKNYGLPYKRNDIYPNDGIRGSRVYPLKQYNILIYDDFEHKNLLFFGNFNSVIKHMRNTYNITAKEEVIVKKINNSIKKNVGYYGCYFQKECS